MADRSTAVRSPIGGDPALLIEHIERRIRDHRRQCKGVVGLDHRARPCRCRARPRRSAPRELVRTSRLPASTGPNQVIGFLLLLLVPVMAQLADPAHLSGCARKTDKPRVVGHDEHPFARDPGRRDAGEILLPEPLAARRSRARPCGRPARPRRRRPRSITGSASISASEETEVEMLERDSASCHSVRPFS